MRRPVARAWAPERPVPAPGGLDLRRRPPACARGSRRLGFCSRCARCSLNAAKKLGQAGRRRALAQLLAAVAHADGVQTVSSRTPGAAPPELTCFGAVLRRVRRSIRGRVRAAAASPSKKASSPRQFSQLTLASRAVCNESAAVALTTSERHVCLPDSKSSCGFLFARAMALSQEGVDS